MWGQVAENPNGGLPLTTPKLKENQGKGGKIPIILGLVMVVIVVLAVVLISKLGTPPTITSQTIQTVIIPTPTSDNGLCSRGIDKNNPLHQDDGQAAQGDQGGFSPVNLCANMTASSYAISFHANSPYISLYLYDSKHAKYEIDYDFYPDHASVTAYPGLSTANAVSLGTGTYSSANWHTYRIEFTNNFAKVLVDGTMILSGSVGFTDDGSGDDLFLQSHLITMDQFSVTRI